MPQVFVQTFFAQEWRLLERSAHARTHASTYWNLSRLMLFFSYSWSSSSSFWSGGQHRVRIRVRITPSDLCPTHIRSQSHCLCTHSQSFTHLFPLSCTFRHSLTFTFSRTLSDLFTPSLSQPLCLPQTNSAAYPWCWALLRRLPTWLQSGWRCRRQDTSSPDTEP